jgi:putative serine protease PepD
MSQTRSSARREQSSGSAMTRRILVVVAFVVLAAVFGFLGGFLGRNVGGPSTTASSGNTCDATDVSNKVLPAVVTIAAEGSSGSGTGSGSIIRSDGYILTNNHVISPAVGADGALSVLYSGGETVPATLVGRDPLSDLAVLKVKTTAKLPIVAAGNSSTLVVGQPVVALGAPLGLSSTVTSGIISALGRTVPVPTDEGMTAVLAGAVQTDASINPGNSGGALVNCAGQLIGVNTAIATVPNAAGQAGGGSVGIGFAVPSDAALKIADELIRDGHITYPSFGVSVSAISPADAQQFGVPVGLHVDVVTPGAALAKAGIQQGDVITKIDGQSATSSEILTTFVLNHKVGDKVPVTYYRNGRTKTVTATLTASPAPTR